MTAHTLWRLRPFETVIKQIMLRGLFNFSKLLPHLVIFLFLRLHSKQDSDLYFQTGSDTRTNQVMLSQKYVTLTGNGDQW